MCVRVCVCEWVHVWVCVEWVCECVYVFSACKCKCLSVWIWQTECECGHLCEPRATVWVTVSLNIITAGPQCESQSHSILTLWIWKFHLDRIYWQGATLQCRAKCKWQHFIMFGTAYLIYLLKQLQIFQDSSLLFRRILTAIDRCANLVFSRQKIVIQQRLK
jgi:hypothetical protein